MFYFLCFADVKFLAKIVIVNFWFFQLQYVQYVQYIQRCCDTDSLRSFVCFIIWVVPNPAQ